MLWGLLAATSVWAQQKISFDIPEQNASAAIQLWARQAGLQVFAADEHLRGVRTRAVRGDYTPLDAARLLVDGTGLEVVSTGEKTVTIRRPNGNGAQHEPVQSSRAAHDADSLEEVVVTGSRIRRAGFDTLQPALVSSAEQIERRGYVNIAQALEATPGFMPGDNSTGNQATFGAGQNFVNFFGLGTNRTLTLVNGRRFVSSNTVAGGNANARAKGHQVDFNVIPAGLVSRVETIAIGGAPIYGADAIAGTVNVILKDNFEGIETSVQYGMAEPGDAETQAYRLMLGGNFGEGRGNAVLGVEYNEQEGLLTSERFTDYRRRTNPLDTGPNDGIPALRVVEGFGFGAITEGGLPFLRASGLNAPGYIGPSFPNGNYIRDSSGTPLKFAPDGTLVPYVVGTVTGSNANFPGVPIEVSGGDRLDPARHTALLAPSQRTLLNGIAHYDFTDNVRVFVELAYAQSEGQELSELAAFAAPTVSGTSITLSVDNPFLPAQSRDILRANGVTGQFSLARNLSDIIDRLPSETTIDLHRLVGGFQGNFEVFGQRYAWDLSYNYGRSQAETKQAYINNTRFLEAIDAISSGGSIICRSGNVACAPLNLFGEGAPSNAAVEYVIDRGIADSTNTQKVMTVNLSGNLPFAIAGPIGFNIGSEYRREQGSFVVDGTLRTGSSLLGAPLAGAYVGTEGHYHTREGYAELVVPVVSDEWNVPVVKALTIETAARYVDNSLAGGDTTWSAGTKFAPRLPGWGDGLTFRGVFTHAIRGPSITELFAGQVPTQGTLSDPCSRLNYNQGPNPSVRAANCAAALAAVGAPAPGAFDSSGTTAVTAVRGFQQGNPNLENESADSWSVGLVYQPTQLPQLRLALDWINISLEDAITTLGIGTLLTQCYDNTGVNPACDAFRRLTPAEAASSLAPRVGGDIANGYRTGFFNTASRDFAGAILAAEYAFAVRGAHRVRLSTTTFYTDKDISVAFAGQDSIESAGTFGVPKFRVQANLGYSWNWLDLDWETAWSDSMILDRDSTLETQPFLEFGSYTLSNVTFGLRIGERFRAQLGVSNVFDKEVPLVGLAVGGYRQYDTIGRRYFATFRASF